MQNRVIKTKPINENSKYQSNHVIYGSSVSSLEQSKYVYSSTSFNSNADFTLAFPFFFDFTSFTGLTYSSSSSSASASSSSSSSASSSSTTNPSFTYPFFVRGPAASSSLSHSISLSSLPISSNPPYHISYIFSHMGCVKSTTSPSTFLAISIQFPKKSTLSTGGGNSYLFSELARPAVLPYK
jgi:hypothetical protein